MDRSKVFEAVDKERVRQDGRWGTVSEHPHEIAGWISLMRKHLDQAERGWWEGRLTDSLVDVMKATSLGVACLEQHGE